jgi:hypothetical protein
MLAAKSARKKIPKERLTRPNTRMLLFCFRASAIAHAPASPILLRCCKTTVNTSMMMEKEKRIQQRFP